MRQIVVMTGSVRQGRAADKILTQVCALLEEQDFSVKIADVKELDLPFLDTPLPPSAEGYAPNHERVKAWGELVSQSDAVIMLTPEYNHAMTAVQKNAIDWLFNEWRDKPVAVVSYGWGGGADSAAQLHQLLGRVRAKAIEPAVQLFFTKDLAIDGAALDHPALAAKVAPVIEALKRL